MHCRTYPTRAWKALSTKRLAVSRNKTVRIRWHAFTPGTMSGTITHGRGRGRGRRVGMSCRRHKTCLPAYRVKACHLRKCRNYFLADPARLGRLLLGLFRLGRFDTRRRIGRHEDPLIIDIQDVSCMHRGGDLPGCSSWKYRFDSATNQGVLQESIPARWEDASRRLAGKI